jgi:hypothetical protein
MSGPFIEDQAVFQLDHRAEILERGLESRGSSATNLGAIASNRTNHAG